MARTLTRCVAATGFAVALSPLAATPGSARSSTVHRSAAIGAGVAAGATAAARSDAAYNDYYDAYGPRSGYYNYAPGYYDYDPAAPYGGAPLGQQGSCHFSIAGC